MARQPHHQRTFPAFAIALVVGGLLIVLLLTGLARLYHVFPGDEWALSRVAPWRGEALTSVARSFNETGWTGTFFPWFPLASVVLVTLTRRWADVALLLGAASIPSLLNLALKELAARPRPDAALALVDPGGYSFPSGHAVFAAAFLGALVFLLGNCQWFYTRPVLRLSAQAVLVVLVFFIGFSRVYLAAHWPSDVIAGLLFGGLCLVLLVAARSAVHDRR